MSKYKSPNPGLALAEIAEAWSKDGQFVTVTLINGQSYRSLHWEFCTDGLLAGEENTLYLAPERICAVTFDTPMES